MMRRILRRAHRGLGLALGGLLALIGLTGSALIFYVEIDAAVHPALPAPSVHPASPSPNWDQAIATLRRTYPDKLGPWRLEVTPDQQTIPARYQHPPERAGRSFAPMLVWLSADGRRVLRRDYWGETAMTWLYDVHYRLLLGDQGAILIGLSGLALLISLILGLALFWPRGSWAKAVRYKRDAVPSRRLRDQHKLIGLISLIPLALFALTGTMLALPAPTAQIMAAFGMPVAMPVPPIVPRQSGRQISVQQAISLAHQHWPEGRLAWIEVPGTGPDPNTGSGAFALRIQVPGDPSRRFPHSYIWIDPYRGTILATQDVRHMGRGAWLLSWLHPLHDGSAGGGVLRSLFCLVGLAPLMLWWTGQRRARIRP